MTRLFNIGVTADMSVYLQGKVRLANQLALILAIAGLVYGILTISFPPITLISAIGILVSISILFLNHLKLYNASRVLAALMSPIVLSLIHAAIVQSNEPVITSLAIGYIAISILPFLIFDFREIKKLMLLIVVIWSIFMFQEYTNQWIDTPFDSSIFYESTIITLTNIISICIITFGLAFYQWKNLMAEQTNAKLIDQLNKQKELTLRQNKDIIAINNKLEENVLERTRDLNEKTKFLNNVLENFPGTVYHGKVDGTIKPSFVSKGSIDVLGKAATELVEKGILNTGIIEPEYVEKIINLSKNIKESKKFPVHYAFTYPIKTKAGRKWIFDKGVFKKDSSGDIYYNGMWLDTTEKVEAEIALKEKKQQLKFLLESSEDMITLHNEQGEYLYYNGPKCYDIKPEDIIGKTPFDLFDKDSANILTDYIKEVFKTGSSVFFESQLDWQGTKKWFSEYIYPVKDEAGNIKSVAKICRDINDRKVNEQNIKESQERLSLIYNSTSTQIGLMKVVGNGRFEYESVNHSVLDFSKKTGNYLQNKDFNSFDVENFYRNTLNYPETKIKDRIAKFNWVISEKKVLEYDYAFDAPGTGKSYFKVKLTPILDNSGICDKIIFATDDVTDKTKSEQALVRSETRLSLIYNNIQDFMVLFRYEGDQDFIAESLNDPAWEVLRSGKLKYPKDEILEQDITSFYKKAFNYDDDLISKRIALFCNAIKNEKSTTYEGRVEIQGKQNIEIFFENTVTPIFNAEGTCTHILWSVKNITERKKNEQLIEQSRIEIQNQLHLNQLILESTFDGYILADINANIVDVNPAYCKLTGYDREELLKMKIIDVENNFSKEAIQQQIQYLKDNKSARFQSKHKRKDGKLLDVDNNLSLVQFKGEYMLAGFIRDISAEKQAQKALEYRLDLESLLSKISSEFINLPLQHFEKSINHALKQLTEFIDFDRCGVVLFDQKLNTGSISYEFCKPGIQGIKDKYQNVPNEAYSWFISRLKKNELLVLNSRNELPEEADTLKNDLTQMGIQSLIHVPLFWQGMLFGFIAFDARKERQNLPNDLEVLLRFAGEMIINVLQRKKGERALIASEKELSMIYNNSNEFIGLLRVENENTFYLQSFNKALIDGLKLVRPDLDANRFIGLAMTDFYKRVLGYDDQLIKERIANWKHIIQKKRAHTYKDTIPISYKGRPFFTFESTQIPIYNSEGRCEYILFVAQDITEQEIAKEALVQSEKRMSSVFNSTKEQMAIFNIEQDGRIILEQVNQSFKDSWQSAGFDLILKNIYGKDIDYYNRVILRLTEKKTKERNDLIQQIIDSKKAVNYEDEYYALNDKKYYVDVTISPILDDHGNCEKVLFVARDISFKKKANELLISKILETEDRERKRISKELHDSLGQNLTTASLNLNHLKNVLTQIDNSYKIKFQNGIKYLNNAIDESRNIAHNLMPQSIVDFGYVLTIESLIENLNDTTDIQFVFYNNLKNERLASYQELSLFRITQEAINNILKHAEAAKVTLQLMKYPETILLTLEDNGKGFEVEKTFGNSFGLNSMKTRVSSLSGSIHIDSKLDKGTSITIEIPA